MSKTVVGLFDDFNQAKLAVQDLESSGFSHSDVSLIANNTNGQYDHYANPTVSSDASVYAASGAGAGALTGTVVGGGLGLLAGLGMLAIPGFGPIIAAGWLVSTITVAGIGAAAGGLLGGLVGAGVPHEEAHLYNEGVRRGGTLIAVKSSDDMAEKAANILDRFGAVNIDERADAYRQPYDISAPIPAASMSDFTPAVNNPPSNLPPGFVPYEPADTQHTRREDSTDGGIKTGGYALDGSPDTRGVTEKMADAVTGDRIDDKTGKPVG